MRAPCDFRTWQLGARLGLPLMTLTTSAQVIDQAAPELFFDPSPSYPHSQLALRVPAFGMQVLHVAA